MNTTTEGGTSYPAEAQRSGLRAARLAILVEFVIRDVGLFVVVGIIAVLGFLPASTSVWPLGVAWTTNVALATAAVVTLLMVFRGVLRQENRPWTSLGYDWSRSALLGGALAGGALLIVLSGTSFLDRALFGSAEETTVLQMIKAAGVPAAILLLVANGFIGPIVEELIWRGYVQGRLCVAWGTAIGVMATAALFVAKHIIVDLSVTRILSLVAGGVAFGVVRFRWGTASSTVTHIIANLSATLAALSSALR